MKPKIRSLTDLLAKLDEEIIWRRKELSILKSLVEDNSGETIKQKVLIRCAVAVLYAHWEGYVKSSSTMYLEYVSSLRLPNEKLKSNLIALSIKKRINVTNASKKVSAANDLAEFFCMKLTSKSNIPFSDVIDLRSNLSSTVLYDVFNCLGFSDTNFKTQKILQGKNLEGIIDTELVDRRNHIAHGNDVLINEEQYLSLHESVTSLIDAFKTELYTFASTRAFER